MNKILITGSSGYIGKHLVEYLAEKNEKLFLIDKKKQTSSRNLKFIKTNLKNYKKLNTTIKKIRPDIIIHLASTKKNKLNTNLHPKNTEDYIIAKNLVESCKATKTLKKFIFLGSCEEYGNLKVKYKESLSEKPKSLYGKTKLHITKYLLFNGVNNSFPCVIIRPSVVYGPNQGKEMFIGEMVDKLLNGKKFEINFSSYKRDFIYISDLIDAIYKVIKSKKNIKGEIINICYGRSYQLISVARIFLKIIRAKSSKLIISNTRKRSDLQENYIVSNRKAFRLLGWKPKTAIKVGLKKII